MCQSQICGPFFKACIKMRTNLLNRPTLTHFGIWLDFVTFCSSDRRKVAEELRIVTLCPNFAFIYETTDPTNILTQATAHP